MDRTRGPVHCALEDPSGLLTPMILSRESQYGLEG